MTNLNSMRSFVLEIDRRIGFKTENSKLIWNNGEIILVTICYHNRTDIPQIINFSGLIETPLEPVVVGDILANSIIDGLTTEEIIDIFDSYEESINNAMIDELDFYRIDESNFSENKEEALS